MRVQVTRDSLLAAIQHVIRSVPPSSPVPILTGIHIQANSRAIILTAGDARLTISYRKQLDEDATIRIARLGAVVVPSRYFHGIIRKLDAGTIDLELFEPFTLLITSGQSQFRLSGMDPSDYPGIPVIEHGCSYPIHMGEFIRAAKQVVIAASASEARPVLTGVLFEFQGSSLHLMATDGIQFASRTLNLESTFPESLRVIVPGKVLNELSKMTAGVEDKIVIMATRKQIAFRFGSVQIISALIEGSFPAMSGLIPADFRSEIICEKERLIKALGRVSILANNRILQLSVTGNVLELHSKTVEVGIVHEKLFLEMKASEDFTLCLNSSFLAEILRSIHNERVSIRYVGGRRPIVIQPQERNDTIFLITPVLSIQTRE